MFLLVCCFDCLCAGFGLDAIIMFARFLLGSGLLFFGLGDIARL